MNLVRIETPKDRFGNEIKEGDIICYPIIVGSDLQLRMGYVTFAHKDYVEAEIKVDTFEGPYKRLVKLTRLYRLAIIPPIQLSDEDREYFGLTAKVDDSELDELLELMHSKECDPHHNNCEMLREKVKELLQRKYLK